MMKLFKSKTGLVWDVLFIGTLAFAAWSMEPATVLDRIPQSTETEADSCSDIRLDDVGGSMEHVEVRNQKAIGSCYAHTSAQIYDAWRFKHGDTQYKRQSSGFEIGQRFKIREGNLQEDFQGEEGEKKSIDGGYVKDVMPLLLEQGSCSQAEMNGLFEGDITVDDYASMVMRRFAKYKKKYLSLKAEARRKEHGERAPIPMDGKTSLLEQFKAEGESRRARARSSEAYTSRLVTEHTQTIDPRQRNAMRSYSQDQYLRMIVLEDGIKDLQELNDSVLRVKDIGIRYEDLKADGDTVDMFNVISIINCPEARRIKTEFPFEVINKNLYHGDRAFGLLGEEKYHPEHALEFINKELNRGLRRAMPVGMAYCSKMLQAGREYKTPPISSGKCGRHASIITGRRRNPETQRCQYLIRNSWGKNCRPYSKDWDCDEEKGSVWVDADVLSRNIFSLQAIRADK